MRTLNRNKQILYYATYRGSEPVFKLDQDGNKIVAYTDSTTEPPTVYYEEESGQLVDLYSQPVQFFGNIAMSGGNTQEVEFGVSVENYQAVLVTSKGELPINETSLLWFETEPEIDEDGYALPKSADYRVVKVDNSINSDRYILAKVVK